MHGAYNNGWLNTASGHTYSPLLGLLMGPLGNIEVGDPQGNFPHLGLTQAGLQQASALGRAKQQQEMQSRYNQALRAYARDHPWISNPGQVQLGAIPRTLWRSIMPPGIGYYRAAQRSALLDLLSNYRPPTGAGPGVVQLNHPTKGLVYFDGVGRPMERAPEIDPRLLSTPEGVPWMKRGK